jgi:hypothetical protein
MYSPCFIIIHTGREIKAEWVHLLSLSKEIQMWTKPQFIVNSVCTRFESKLQTECIAWSLALHDPALVLYNNVTINYRIHAQLCVTVENFITDWLTDSKEKSPSREVNNHSASHETPSLLWNLKVPYCVNKSLPLVLTWARWIQSTPYHPWSIFHSMPRSSRWSLPFRFSNKNILWISHLSCVCYMSHPSHPPWFDHPNNIWWSIQVMKLLICSLLQPPAISSLLDPNIPPTPCSLTPSIYTPPTTTSNIMVLYTLSF